MKTAISVPDRTFQRVNEAAKRLGLSRSEVFARAAERWLDGLEDKATTEAIDRVLADVEQDNVTTLGPFAHDLLRRLVLAQAEESRMPQPPSRSRCSVSRTGPLKRTASARIALRSRHGLAVTSSPSARRMSMTKKTMSVPEPDCSPAKVYRSPSVMKSVGCAA